MRELQPGESGLAYAAMVELGRDVGSPDDFAARVDGKLRPEGYRLLGVFEAGFFPGVILYFTYWYPSVRRGQVIAIFMSATTIISVIRSPASSPSSKAMSGTIKLIVESWYGCIFFNSQ